MRKNILNNSLTNISISKGGVLYRPGEIPMLTKSQVEQAKLVGKLPHDFPIENWENMNTKHQLQQMKYSGLNAQEQWSLLNSSVPLAALNRYNQAQTQSESMTLAARAAASLLRASANATVPPSPTPGKSSSNYTPSLSGGLRQKLTTVKEEYKKTPIGKASGGIGRAIPVKGTVKAGAGSEIENPNTTPTSTPLRYIIELASPTPSPRTTPSPSPIPTPSPKPTPTPTPRPTANLDIIGQFVADKRNQKNPFYLKYSQLSGDRSDCSTQVFDFYEIKGEKNPLRGADKDTCEMYYKEFTNPPDSFTENGGIVQSSVPSDNRHGIPRIPDNWKETTEVGDLVIWKDKAEFGSSGYLVIKKGDDWHVGLCIGGQQMVDRGIWEENNPNGKEYGIFARGLDTVKSSYDVIMIIKPGDEVRLTLDNIYDYLLNHQ